VIAEDQDGRPALAAHTLGAGKTLLSAYPLEHYLAVKPSAFEGREDAHRLYDALRTWAGVQVDFWSGNPAVETGAISGQGRAYIILTNHSAESQIAIIHARGALKSAALITGDGSHPIQIHGNSWEMEIPAWDGKIVEVKW